jgi:UDP-2-acetamido-2,6-beta-L-arabino-hexul-4-ose reductase
MAVNQRFPNESRVRIEQLRRAIDERGQVFEPLDADGLAAQRNVHVVLTHPGHIRGNHVHASGSEVTVVAGPARVRYREGAEVKTIDVPAAEVWRFSFPPGVAHAFQNTGDAPMVIVSFNTQTHDPDRPDTAREVLL